MYSYSQFLKGLYLIFLVIFVVALANAQTIQQFGSKNDEIVSEDNILVSQTITYQGVLKDNSGNPVRDGSYRLIFRVYDDANIGNLLWTCPATEITTVNGYFTTEICADVSYSGKFYYLSVQVEGDEGEMLPRQKFFSSHADDGQEPPIILDYDTWYKRTGNVLETKKYWGIAKGKARNVWHGDKDSTMINLGVESVTGQPLGNYAYATVGGGLENTASHDYTTVSGGYKNTASGASSSIGGGYGDTTKAIYGGVFSGYSNLAGDESSDIAPFVGGGYNNSATASYATVGGGKDNTASSDEATVGGGSGNYASGDYAVVSGGYSNSASLKGATVGGGLENTASGFWSTIAGGTSNTASSSKSTVAGGASNNASGNWSSIGGGGGNTASGESSTVMGGGNNTASGLLSTVSGGGSNSADGDSSTVCGGNSNNSFGDLSIVGGGLADTSKALYGGVFSGYSNLAGDESSDIAPFVGGGYNNSATASYSTVGGGKDNTVSSDHATVGGGSGNSASGYYATVSGGASNNAGDEGSTVNGGLWNQASGIQSVVGGGEANTASGNYSTISGGYYNTASGNHSTVPGGRDNYALGNYSFAAGWNAIAVDSGTFVWADASVDGDFNSAGANQFLIRASGGVGINTSDAVNKFVVSHDLTSQDLVVDYATGNVGVGTASPNSKLEVGGTVHSTIGGFKFPDGTLQETAAAADNDWVFDGNDMYSGVSGNVGIGVSPNVKFETAGTIRSSYPTDETKYIQMYYDQTEGPKLESVGFTKLHISPDGQNTVTVTSDRKVGIGTDSPAKELEIGGNGAIRTSYLDPGTRVANYEFIRFGADTEFWAGFMHNIDDVGYGNGDDFAIYTDGGRDMVLQSGAGQTHILGGDVGIGTTDPQAKLDIAAVGDGAEVLRLSIQRSWAFRQLNTGQYTSLELASIGGDGNKNFIINTAGNVGIGITSPSEKLHVNGEILTEDTVTVNNSSGSDIVIIGECEDHHGKITLKNAGGSVIVEIGRGLDYAESFSTPFEYLDPGTVMIIDPQNPGNLHISSSAYDKKVAGIVAGANGLGSGVMLGATGSESEHPVALAGRVYCKVDGRYGSIEPGDLLTTSPTPGYAMVVKDSYKAQGAIIGKAMEPMPEGQEGQILVLVTLQ